MKKSVALLVFLLLCASFCHAESLTFEGKAGPLIKRSASIPWPMLVERLLVATGQDVQKGEALLEYRLEARDRRGIQQELSSGGASLDASLGLAGVGQELYEASIRSKTSGDLASRGLASSQNASQDARAAQLVRRKQNLLQTKSDIAAGDFALRLAEFETYFGQKLKRGQKLPDILRLPAPIAGTVIDVTPNARPGGLVGGGVPVVTIARLNPIQVEIQVHEREITKLHVGQELWVEPANNEKVRLKGKISQISWQPADPTIAVPSFYFVYIDVENPDHLLKPGYKVLAHLDVD